MKILNRYPLATLRALEAVGRLGQLAGAADELGVTPGAISQHLRKAKAQLVAPCSSAQREACVQRRRERGCCRR
jgi:hypothetical protein